jgi:cytochrome c-type biogenesis protein CcmE
MNKHIKQRIYYISLLGMILILGCYFVLKALQQNINLYLTPSQLKAATETYVNRSVRIGGLVKKDSVVYGPNQTIQFIVTDGEDELLVHYQGLLPGLFKPGKGVVVEGRYEGKQLKAALVLAKHDENYAPPKVKV